MLAFFRAFSKSWVANVFFVVLIGAFSLWGIKDVFHSRISTAVIEAGKHSVEPADFKRVFENYRKQQMQQTGQMITAKDAVAAGIDLRMVDDLSGQEALAAGVNDAARQTGMALGVALLGAFIPTGALLGTGDAHEYVGGLHTALWVATGIAVAGLVAGWLLIRPASVAGRAAAAPSGEVVHQGRYETEDHDDHDRVVDPVLV